jgi:hypothetical protein
MIASSAIRIGPGIHRAALPQCILGGKNSNTKMTILFQKFTVDFLMDSIVEVLTFSR